MPRRLRLEAPGALHHVVVQAASGGRIVVDDADRLRFLDELRAVVGGHGWRCGAYCVMDTHAHVVVCTPEPNLGEGMKLLLGRYAFVHNRRHSRRGHLFGRRFWSRRLDKPHYLRCAALYTVLNPVVAGMCAHPSRFPWSSYRETAGAAPASGLLEPGLVLQTLDDDVDAARARYVEIVDDALARLGRRRAEEAWWRTVERAAAATPETG
jgi:REP element-mobilizing transposase RayT